MGLYERYVLPRVLHTVCGLDAFTEQRKKVVPRAEGRVLEIGMGSGLNLPHYDPNKVSKLWGLEPAEPLRQRAGHAARGTRLDVELLAEGAEDLSLEPESVDTVLTTYTLCTIADVGRALGQAARVLKADGSLIFCEHGLAPDTSVARWQRRLDPLWKPLSGGCHLGRDIPKLIEAAGFRIVEMEAGYIPGWRPACFNYWGRAVRA